MKHYTFFSSDAFGRDLAIMDDQGNKIEGVTEFTIRGSMGEPITAEITVVGVSENLQVGVREINFLCPNCGDTVYHECEGLTLGGT